jgi:hypothetical protein
VGLTRRDNDRDFVGAGGEGIVGAALVGHERNVDTPARRWMPAITSAAFAICGIAFGLTNDAASMRVRPVAERRSTSSIF